MSLTTDRTDPRLRTIRPDGQQEAYLVLSDEERAKGFVRPVRRAYRHLKCGGVTTMGRELAETYARDLHFYGATMCCVCGRHFRLIDPGGIPAFYWEPDGDPVGSNAEEAAAFFAARDAREAKKHVGGGI